MVVPSRLSIEPMRDGSAGGWRVATTDAASRRDGPHAMRVPVSRRGLMCRRDQLFAGFCSAGFCSADFTTRTAVPAMSESDGLMMT